MFFAQMLIVFLYSQALVYAFCLVSAMVLLTSRSIKRIFKEGSK